MLTTFWDAYTSLPTNARGPSGEVIDAKKAVLKDKGDLEAYTDTDNDNFLWYRYLFLSRSKPSTHIAALSKLSTVTLELDMPEFLNALLTMVNNSISPEAECDDDLGI